MNARQDEDTVTEFETVEGIDPATVRLKREYEAQVERKVMNESSHIIWAYGLLWLIFVGYAVMLWRKAQGLRRDLGALQAELSRTRP